MILDEVHSYDSYTGSILDKLIERLLALECTVLVLSATLTTKRREELLQLAGASEVPLPTEYPLLSYVDGGGKVISSACATPPEAVREVAVRCCSAVDIGLLDEVCERAKTGACVLLIKNTVAEAQAVFGALQSIRREGGPEIGLLHSRFPQFRREEQEALWMERLGKTDKGIQRPPGCVLVATQVVEQSVDIDADLLVTDLAPTDMMLQRIGRLWRHERGRRPVERPEVWIICPEVPTDGGSKMVREAFGKSARVYAPYVLLRSLEVWQSREQIRLPEEIRPLLDATYQPRVDDEEPPAWFESRHELERRIAAMRNVAFGRANILENIDLKDEEGVQTRWNDFPSANLVLLSKLPRLNSVKESELDFLNGDAASSSSFEWRFAVAAAIHRNA